MVTNFSMWLVQVVDNKYQQAAKFYSLPKQYKQIGHFKQKPFLGN